MQREQLENVAQRFLRRCDAQSTRVAYSRELTRFLGWLTRELGPDLLLDYRDHLRERGLARSTVRWRLTVVRAFLEFAQERGHLDGTVDLQLRLPKGQRGFAPRVLSRNELKRLLDAPDRRTWLGARDAAVLACLGLGGLRASEVCALRPDDLQISRTEIVLRVQGKGGKLRSVTLPLPAAAAVRGWWRRREREAPGVAHLFGRSETEPGRPLDAHAVRYLVRRHARRVGLASVSPHSLRHTEATLAIARGLPLHRVQARLGHASILTTVAYLNGAGAGI